MTYNQYQDLKNNEIARHQKVIAELDFRMKALQLSCLHVITIRIGEFTDGIQVQCQQCGHTLMIKKGEPLSSYGIKNFS